MSENFEPFDVYSGPSAFIMDEELPIGRDKEKIEELHKSLYYKNRPAFSDPGFRILVDLTAVEGAWSESLPLQRQGTKHIDDEPIRELAESANIDHNSIKDEPYGIPEFEILIADIEFESYPGHSEFCKNVLEVKRMVEDVSDYLELYEEFGRDWEDYAKGVGVRKALEDFEKYSDLMFYGPGE